MAVVKRVCDCCRQLKNVQWVYCADSNYARSSAFAMSDSCAYGWCLPCLMNGAASVKELAKGECQEVLRAS